MFTPYRQITIVHAVQQPIDPPKFGTFRPGRSLGDTYATLIDDNLYVHGRKFTPQETLEKASGARLDAGPYVRYLKSKYAG